MNNEHARLELAAQVERCAPVPVDLPDVCQTDEPGRVPPAATAEQVCGICLGVMKSPTALPCDHSFCETCLDGWHSKYDSRRAKRCPLCRQRIPPSKEILMQLRSLSTVEIGKRIDDDGIGQLMEREAAHRWGDSLAESDITAMKRLEVEFCKEDNYTEESRHKEDKSTKESCHGQPDPPVQKSDSAIYDFGQLLLKAPDRIMATLLQDWSHEEIAEMIQNLPPENGRLPPEAIVAFFVNDIEYILGWLESSNYDVNAMGSGLGRVTLLFGSCNTQNLEFTSFLLQEGANTEIMNIVGHTALGNELHNRTELSDAARLLLTWGAKIPAKSDFSTYFDDLFANKSEGWEFIRESTLLQSEFGGRRCELINLNQRADLMGKTCVVMKYLPRKDRYKIKMEHSDESFLVGPDNLKRRDRTPDDPGYYINYENGQPVCYKFTSNEKCQAFVRNSRAGISTRTSISR